MDKPQLLGVLPTSDFWHGNIQARKHFLGKKFFFLTFLQVLPLAMIAGVLSVFTSIGPGVAGMMGVFLGLGINREDYSKKTRKEDDCRRRRLELSVTRVIFTRVCDD